jgi:predicted acetyltransferase
VGITLSRMDSSTRPAFLALSQQYEAEVSRITGKLPDASGQYEITDETSEKYQAWVFHNEQQIAGFAVIDVSLQRTDVAEFYIVPALRGKHLGEMFAMALFDSYSGDWQVRQIQGAEYARAFWEQVIRRYSDGVFDSSTENDPEWGSVYIQRFTSKKR